MLMTLSILAINLSARISSYYTSYIQELYDTKIVHAEGISVPNASFPCRYSTIETLPELLGKSLVQYISIHFILEARMSDFS